EGEQTRRALMAAFPDAERFAVHRPLPGHAAFADEGAANHVRLAAAHGERGVELFVHGREEGEAPGLSVPARQSRLACEAVARAHGLDPARTVHVAQSPAALEAGAFHNDVVCVGALTTLFVHEQAFAEPQAAYDRIAQAAAGLFAPQFVIVPASAVPLRDAITSYLFNSQLLETPGANRLVLIAPVEAEENPATRAYCAGLAAGDGPIGAVEFVDVRQSMRNGGGPACLRLRVVLTEAEQAAASAAMMLDDALYERLCDWVRRRYRDRLAPNDLADPALLDESRTALDELTGILLLGADFYPFQRA
ncbi:MAG: N-succinylarginine dihydrolase, partial [Caulobacterales bacterium]|nr:N-succinylarginine dihydrolase [Caulobacterales bacterium]